MPWGLRRDYTKISRTFTLRVTGREAATRSCDKPLSCEYSKLRGLLVCFSLALKTLFSSSSAQRRSRLSTLSLTRFRHSADSWRRSWPGPGTWPWCWKGQLNGSLTLEVGMGRVQPPGLRGALSLTLRDVLSDHSTVEWHLCEVELSVDTDAQFSEKMRREIQLKCE